MALTPTQQPFKNTDKGNLFLKLYAVAQAFDPTLPALPANIKYPTFQPYIDTDNGDISLVIDTIISAIGTFAGGEAIINHITPTGGTLTVTGNETITGNLNVRAGFFTVDVDGNIHVQNDATILGVVRAAQLIAGGGNFLANADGDVTAAGDIQGDNVIAGSNLSGATATIAGSAIDIGDKLSVNGQTSIAGKLIATSFQVGGSAGVSGTFTTADAKTVTVTNGIITSIV